MALNYKLEQRTINLGGKKRELTVARGVYFAETSIEQLCRLIEQISAVSEGDVRSVLNTLSNLVAMELEAGRIVSVGQLGRFRLSPRCKSAESEETFGKGNLQTPRLLFVPGAALRNARKNVSYRLTDLASGVRGDEEPDKKPGAGGNDPEKPGTGGNEPDNGGGSNVNG